MPSILTFALIYKTLKELKMHKRHWNCIIKYKGRFYMINYVVSSFTKRIKMPFAILCAT